MCLLVIKMISDFQPAGYTGLRGSIRSYAAFIGEPNFQAMSQASYMHREGVFAFISILSGFQKGGLLADLEKKINDEVQTRSKGHRLQRHFYMSLSLWSGTVV